MTAGTKLLRSSAFNLWGDWGTLGVGVRVRVRTYCLHTEDLPALGKGE